ncbi:PLDc N-terminal domain-containing protein [Paenibacillus sp. EC2-1]|uniref:PLDc N-terminal domain-containing protein n=1 Tax=Paenibacillus sp. EC2-1 TaxID=3388665 RepID=UPI003BEF08DF
MNINWGLIWPLIALQFVLMVTALISLYKVETANLRGPKWMWVLIIVLLNIVGSIAYFVAGRKEV